MRDQPGTPREVSDLADLARHLRALDTASAEQPFTHVDVVADVLVLIGAAMDSAELTDYRGLPRAVANLAMLAASSAHEIRATVLGAAEFAATAARAERPEVHALRGRLTNRTD